MGNEEQERAETLIEIIDLHISFGQKKVLTGVDLVVEKGESLVIIGGSGVGKSILMKCVLGLNKPESGTIRIKGQDIAGLSERKMNNIRRNIGMVFQEGALFDSMSVGENVAFGLTQHTKMKKKEIAERVAECLKRVGLPGLENERPSHLSGGMRKRVSLARAIAYEPEIIIYDEPTSALDPIMADVINSLINRLRDQLNVTSVTITHDLASARKIADRIAVLINGRIIETGRPEEIFNSENPYVRQFVTGSAEGPIEVLQ